VKEGWVTKTLGEVCEIVNGGTPKTDIADYWGGEHLWVTPAEMGKLASPYKKITERTLTSLGLQKCSAKLVPPYSVIISSRAPIGHLIINMRPMATNQGCKSLVPKQVLNYKFLFYKLTAIKEDLDRLGGRSYI